MIGSPVYYAVIIGLLLAFRLVRFSARQAGPR